MISFDGTETVSPTPTHFRLHTATPKEPPPTVPLLNRNPRKHDVVAWRNDGRIDTARFETKEAAIEHGRALSWVIYYQWSLMDGRQLIEKHQIAAPAGMALDDGGLPIKI